MESELTVTPELWDGFTFSLDDAGERVTFTFFDDMAKKHGQAPKDPSIPEDRESFHVLLTSVRKAVVMIEAPFTSCFLDPFVYARRIAHMGFSGVMLRDTEFAKVLVRDSVFELMEYHKKRKGFVFRAADGIDTVYKGKHA